MQLRHHIPFTNDIFTPQESTLQETTLRENNAPEAEVSGISAHLAQSRKVNLTAQWVTENGKLVCKWVVDQT